MVNHVIPAVFSYLTEIYAEQVIIKEPDKFLSWDRDLLLRPSVCESPEMVKKPLSEDKVPAEFHRLLRVAWLHLLMRNEWRADKR